MGRSFFSGCGEKNGPRRSSMAFQKLDFRSTLISKHGKVLARSAIARNANFLHATGCGLVKFD